MPDDKVEFPAIAMFPDAESNEEASIKTEAVEDYIFPADMVRMEEEETCALGEDVRLGLEGLEESNLWFEDEARRLEEETTLQEKERQKHLLLYPTKSLWEEAAYALTSEPSPGPLIVRTESIPRMPNFRIPSRDDFAALPSDTADCLGDWVQSNVEGTHFYDTFDYDRLSSYCAGA